jgi:hypothetical protein
LELSKFEVLEGIWHASGLPQNSKKGKKIYLKTAISWRGEESTSEPPELMSRRALLQKEGPQEISRYYSNSFEQKQF